MKKVYLGLLATSLIGLLAACGGSSNNDYVIKEGDSVVNEKFMQANIKENESFVENIKPQKYTFELPEGYTRQTSNWNDGYVVIEKGGKYGLYSIMSNSIIVDARIVDPFLYGAQIESDYAFGFYAVYQEPTDEKYYVIDGAGNVIYSTKTEIDVTDVSIDYNYYTDELTKKGALYSCYEIKDAEATPSTFNLYFSYDANNVASPSNAAAYSGWKEPGKGETPESRGTVYDLSECGLEGTLKFFMTDVRGVGDIYSAYVYGTDGTLKASIEYPEGYGPELIGKKLIAQKLTGTDGTYVLDTKVFNLETLKEEEFDEPAYFSDFIKLQSVENDEHQYFAATFQEINNGRKGAIRTMILDEKGKFHDDITRKNFPSWIKLQSGYYYDQTAGILYDTEFNQVLNTLVSSYRFYETREIFYKEIVYRDPYSSDPYSSSKVYEVLNNKGQVIFDEKVYLKTTYPTYNTVYSALDTETNREVYADIATGKTFALAVDSGKGKTKVEESTYGWLIRNVTRTYEDDERTTEITAFRKGSVRTFDGEEIASVDSKLVSLSVITGPRQSLVTNGARFYVVSYSVTGVSTTTYLVVYNKLITAKAVPAPAAA